MTKKNTKSAKDDALEGEILGREESAQKKSTHWAVYLSLALVIFIGGLFAAPYAERAMVMLGVADDEPAAADLSGFIADMSQTVDAQSAKIDSLSGVLTALEKYEDAQNDEMKDIVRRLRAIEARPVVTAGEGVVAAPVDLSSIHIRLEALEAHTSHVIGVDLTDVEARLAALEAQEVRTVASDEAVRSLKTFTLEAEHAALVKALAAEFKPLIPDALRADARGVDEGVWANIKGWAKTLVVVRPTDDLASDTLAARLGRAEKALDEGTLQGLQTAMVEVTGVAGPAREVLMPWLMKANEALQSKAEAPNDEGPE